MLEQIPPVFDKRYLLMHRQWRGWKRWKRRLWRSPVTEQIFYLHRKVKQLEVNVFKMWFTDILWTYLLILGWGVRIVLSLCGRLSYFSRPFGAMRRAAACNCWAAASRVDVGLSRQWDGRAWGQRISREDLKGLCGRIEWADHESLSHIWGNDKGGQMENGNSGWVEGSTNHC